MQQLGVWIGKVGVQVQQQERGMWAAKLYYLCFYGEHT